jgi:hypothetical protein
MSSDLTPRRPALSRSPFRNPLVASLTCLAMAGAAGSVEAVLAPDLGITWAVILRTIAAIGVAGAVLVLARSTAIRRIDSLRRRGRQQADELARMTLYSEQIGEALNAVGQFRDGRGQGDLLLLVESVMQASATRASAVFDPAVRLYLVQLSPHAYVVKAAAGIERFGLEVGKQCVADRPLDDVLPRLGRYWYTAPILVGGSKYTLVLLSEERPMRLEREFVDQLAAVLSLAGEKGSDRRRRTRDSASRLHAV